MLTPLGIAVAATTATLCVPLTAVAQPAPASTSTVATPQKIATPPLDRVIRDQRSLAMSSATRSISAATAQAPSTTAGTTAGTTSFRVAPGKVVSTAGSTRFTDGTASVTFTVPPNPGPGLYLGSVVRASGNSVGYRGKVRVVSGGPMYLRISRVRNGVDTDLVTLKLATVPVAGQQVRIDTSVSGSSAVLVKARAWIVGRPTPGWQTSFQDTTSSRITTAGTSSAWAYLSSRATSTVTVPYSGMSTAVNVPTPPAPPAPAPPAPADPAGWKLNMQDDFDSLSPTRWNVKNNTYASNEDSYLLARNTSVANGRLRIQGKLESASGHDYTSGYVNSIGKYSLPNYFRAEVRAKVPFQQGLWAAPLWFRPTTGGAGEIDLVETLGKERRAPSFHQTIHTEYGATHQQAAVARTFASVGTGAATDWHTYTIEKTPGRIVMWVDGVQTAKFTPGSPSWYDRYYEAGKSWNLRINMQIGGTWGGLPDSTTDWSPDSSAMQLDSIKTWVPN